MFKSLGIRIPAFNIGLALVSSLIMAFFCWETARTALVDAAKDKLAFAAAARKTSIDQVFARARSDIAMLAASRELASNFEDLQAGLDPANATRNDIIQAFRAPEKRADRIAIDGRSTGGQYGIRHAKVHEVAAKFVAGGYADALLIDDKGLIIYTTAKDADFGQTLATAPYKDSGLARLIDRMKATKSKTPLYEDFGAYPASRGPSAFLVMPITRKANAAMGTEQETVLIGYLALRLEPTSLAMLADREGLGESGQVFVVDQQGMLLSQPPLDTSVHPGDAAGKLGFPTEQIAGGGTTLTYTRADGAEKIVGLAAAQPMGARWTIIAEQAKSEALSSVSTLTHRLLISLLIVMAVTIVAGLLVARSIVRPILAIAERMKGLSSGDVTSDIPGLKRADEIGRMAQTVAIFRENAKTLADTQRRAEEARLRQDAERAAVEAERAALAQQQAQVVTSVATALHQLAEGNLLHELRDPFAPEYERLRADFNLAVHNLRQTMSDVLERTMAIRDGTRQLTVAADDLSRRTDQQSAGVEETAATLSDLTKAVGRSAEASGEARQAVTKVRSDAEKSSEVLSRTADAMMAIEKSSEKVSQITNVIDGIAFQTNLLALNAGVEAARAGEAGRGFAVVATEVRALSERSAEAAKEIKTLLSESDSQVKAGVELVVELGEAVQRIIRQITEIDGIIADLAANARQQANGLAEINASVNQIEAVTQQNATMAEQASTASHDLAGEGVQLGALVGRFKVGENGRIYASAA